MPFFSWVRVKKKKKDKTRAGLKLNQGLEKVLEIQKKPTILKREANQWERKKFKEKPDLLTDLAPLNLSHPHIRSK